MKKLVAWSGGVDSTSLVWWLLGEGHRVETLYIDIECNAEKAKREKAAIDKMLEIMKPYPIHHIGESKLDLKYTTEFELAQPAIWLLGLAYACGEGVEEVNVGYVMSDQAISWLPEIEAMWQTYSGLMRQKLPPIKFPFIKKDKRDLWAGLDPRLRELTTWCESYYESPVPCGSCVPCERMKYLGLLQNPDHLKPKSIDQIVDIQSVPFYP